MKVERNNFRSHFQSFPNWNCPSCLGGKLKQVEGALNKIETGSSKRQYYFDEWEPDWIVERFCNFLRCDNKACGEICSISGSTSNYLAQNFNDHEGPGEPELITYYHPKSLTPSPHVFSILPSVPQNLRDSLLGSGLIASK